MKSIVKAALRAGLRSFPRYGAKLTNYLMSAKLDAALRGLRGQGIRLAVIYDVGARHGDWSATIRRALPDATFLLFEANETCRPALEARGFPFFISVLSSQVGTVEFYGDDSTGDSYYRENTPSYRHVQATERATLTLDGIVAEHGLPLPDLIKLDTQGSELDILRGGLTCLQHASAIYVECPILDYNHGAPQIQNYLEFMGQHGFVPCDICEIHYAEGAVVQIDALFVRRAAREHGRGAAADRIAVSLAS